MGFGGDSGGVDIAGAASLSEERLQFEISHCLGLKGYCVLDLGFEEEKLYDVIDELKDLRGESRFVPPPQEVVDGLLGAEGSGEYCWLAYPDSAEDEEGENIRILDRKLVDLANSASLFCVQNGHPHTSRTESCVLRGGEPDYEGPELTEATCSKWLSILTQAKLMMLYFLGPGEGFLELQPFDEDAGSVELETRPDMMVILRCDMIGHKHSSSIRDYTVCNWVVTPDATTSRGWPSLKSNMVKTVPAAQELVNWTQARLETLLQLEMTDPEFEGVPREWQRMMRQSFFKSTQHPIAVRGEASHVPGQWDGEALWMAENVGADCVQGVPFERWDHTQYYDADPNAYLTSHTFPGGQCKTSIKHMMYIDGGELFDAKFFGMSVAESKGMDPGQRHILETSYGCMFQAGFKKKDLMNNYIAVFTGCTNPEWNYIPHETGAQSGTGGSQAITSNRVSFLLGMMGPSTSIDCDMASAGMALMLGCTAVNKGSHERREESGGFSNAAAVGGVYFCLTPYMWPRMGAFMNPFGRVFSFDSSANGYVRGDSCVSLCLRNYMETIDDKMQPADLPCIGTITGWRMVNNGKGASLTAPYGPAEQEATHDAVKHAGIGELDVDGFDCHGIGMLLADSVEFSSLAQSLRGMKGGDEEVLITGAVKTNLSAAAEACAMHQMLKVIYNLRYANNAPNLHLKQISPHIETGEAALVMNSEGMPYPGRSAFHGLATRGLGGTNICLIPWFAADEERVAVDKPDWQGQPFAFWPGGGGMLESEQKPMEGYYIIGSWNEWKPQEMERSPEGDFLCNVTLGINGYEVFQFLLDFDSDKVLHPGMTKAWSGSQVLGPCTAGEADVSSWCIDGRVETYSEEGFKLALATETEEGALATQDPSGELYSRDKGRPGDQYQINLQIAGKYRAVTWRKLEASEKGATVMDSAKVLGKYYVFGAWSGWSFEEMQPVEGEPGLYRLELPTPPGFTEKPYREFQIVRNKDLDQNFFPPERLTSRAGEVMGPGEGAGTGLNWLLEGGAKGSSFVIEFCRKVESGKEVRKVSWRPTET